ncbi:MAG: tetratricopeptide repeat protein [Bergeyella zoohelcum]|nr:tetratricopeptide repeat protein [Bergeyella zoohelcum]
MDDFFENELVEKFEEMIENNEELYFDTDEVEEIIIHYLEMGDISFAEIAVNFGLKLHPNSTEIKTKQLEVFLELEDYQGAKQLIDELEPTCQEETDYLICCAKYYSNLGNPKKSINYCQKALKYNEEENFIHNFIADEYVNLGDPSMALRHYKKALQTDPDDDYALENCMTCFSSLNRSAEAIAFLNEFLDDCPFSETAWYEYGQFFFNRKNYQEAIKGFDYLLAINPYAVGVYSNKAACYEAMNQYDKAIKTYEETLDLEYTKAYTYYRIGLCHKAMKRLLPALSSFQKALAEDPQFYMAMMEQSYLYEEMGEMPEALYFAREATSLYEESIDYQKRLAFLYIEANQFEESLHCLKKITEQEPNRFYNWYAYTEVLMLLEEYEEAVTVIKNALKLHHRAELFYQLSNCWYHLGNREEGAKALQTALELDESLVADMQNKYPFIKDEMKGR